MSLKLIHRILLFSTLCCLIRTVHAQTYFHLYEFESEPDHINHIVIHNSYGSIIIHNTSDQIRVETNLLFSPDIRDQAKKLSNQISIRQRLANDTLYLTTIFNEKLGLKNNLLWGIREQINIEFQIQLPPTIGLDLTQKSGAVVARQVSNKLNVEVDNGSVKAHHVSNLFIRGTSFNVDAATVDHLEIEGIRGDLFLTSITTAVFNLEKSVVNAVGFTQLDANLELCVFQSGRTFNSKILASQSTIEMTNMVKKAECDFEDVHFVLHKIPDELDLRMVRGLAQLDMSQGRKCIFKLAEKDAEVNLRLRGSSLGLDYDIKKTNLVLPEAAISKNKHIELIQPTQHSLRMIAQLNAGELQITR